MNSSLKKTGTIVIIILMIVSIFFVYREFASLNENEKIVEEIYSDQLETILTSINGKIEDVISDYNNVLGSAVIKNPALANRDIQTLLSNNKSISSIFFADSTGNIIKSFGSTKTDFNTAQLKKIFTKLNEYSKNNYYKIEPIAADSDNILLVKLLPLSVGNIFTGITIHPDIFINDVISAQLELLISEQYRNRLLISVSKKILLFLLRE